MGASLGGEGVMAELNLTPLIDIVLVVLIIMMVNMPIEVDRMGVKLPDLSEQNEPPPPPPIDPPEQLVIALYEDGRIALNRKVMTEEKMQYEVGRRLRPMEKKNVFIDAHAAVPYGRVVDMVDLAREAGAEKVGFAKMKVDGPRAPNSVDSGAMPRGVHVLSPTTIGARGASQADDALQVRMPMIESCYAQALGRSADRSGRIMLRVTVAPDGSLMDQDDSGSFARIGSSNTEDRELDECVRQVGERLEFPAIEENATAIVQYPLLFSPG